MSLTDNQKKCFEGFLEKKTESAISMFRKRFYVLVEGQILVYFENKDDLKFRNYFLISEISEPESIGEKNFKLKYKDQSLEFKAPSQEERDKWINSLSYCREYVRANKNLLQHYAYILRQRGLLGWELNEKGKLLLEDVGFNSLWTLADLKKPRINKRFYSRIITDHTTGKQQKRFLVLFSRRPLSNADYIMDKETNNEFYESKENKWLKYDYIHLFQFDKGKGKFNTELKTSIDISQLQTIRPLERKEKHVLLVGHSNNSYNFSFETKEENEEFIEYMLNSHRTARLMAKSKTGKPRNTSFLINLFKHKKDEFNAVIESDKKKIIGNNQITSFSSINIFTQNFQEYVEPTIDGCIHHYPPYQKIAYFYLKQIDTFYYQELERFWKENKDTINQKELVILSMTLTLWSKKLFNSYNICDCDLELNAKKFMKIFIKNSYVSIIKSVEELINQSLNDDINPPTELFNLFKKTFDNVKLFSHKFSYEQSTLLFYNCIIQYIIGVDAFSVGLDKEVTDDSLVKIVNNLNAVIIKTNHLVKDISETEIINQREIVELFQLTSLFNHIKLGINNALIKLCYNHINDIEQIMYNEEGLEKININDIKTLINNTFKDTYDKLQKENKQDFMKLILYWTISYYVKMIFRIENISKLKEIEPKIQNDIKLIRSVFGEYLRPFPSNAMKIITDILEAINVLSTTKFERKNKKKILAAVNEMIKHVDFSFAPIMISSVSTIADYAYDEKANLLAIIKAPKNTRHINELNLIFWNVWHTNPEEINTFSTSLYDKFSDQNEEMFDSSYEESETKINDPTVIKDGVLRTKFMNKWKSFYFQLKSDSLCKYKNNSCNELLETINTSNIIYCSGYKEDHLLLVIKYDHDNEKNLLIRKYVCEEENDTNNWVKKIKEIITANKDNQKIIVIDGKNKLIEEKIGMTDEFLERNTVRRLSLNRNLVRRSTMDFRKRSNPDFSLEFSDYSNEFLGDNNFGSDRKSRKSSIFYEESTKIFEYEEDSNKEGKEPKEKNNEIGNKESEEKKNKEIVNNDEQLPSIKKEKEEIVDKNEDNKDKLRNEENIIKNAKDNSLIKEEEIVDKDGVNKEGIINEENVNNKEKENSPIKEEENKNEQQQLIKEEEKDIIDNKEKDKLLSESKENEDTIIKNEEQINLSEEKQILNENIEKFEEEKELLIPINKEENQNEQHDNVNEKQQSNDIINENVNNENLSQMKGNQDDDNNKRSEEIENKKEKDENEEEQKPIIEAQNEKINNNHNEQEEPKDEMQIDQELIKTKESQDIFENPIPVTQKEFLSKKKKKEDEDDEEPPGCFSRFCCFCCMKKK